MKADDLTGILASTPAVDTSQPDTGMHIGQVLAFDPVTGENTINMAGSPIENLPMLNIGDTTNLAVGDQVVILYLRSAYFILGRVVAPNTETLFTSAVSFDARDLNASGFAIGTTESAPITATFPIPDWANRVSITAVAHFNGKNSTASDDYMLARVWIESSLGSQNLSSRTPAGAVGYVAASFFGQTSVLPGEFDVTARIRTNFAGWAADGLNVARLSVGVIYTRVPES